MFLVCFTDLKFALALDPLARELQIQHTSRPKAVTNLLHALVLAVPARGAAGR